MKYTTLAYFFVIKINRNVCTKKFFYVIICHIGVDYGRIKCCECEE